MAINVILPDGKTTAELKSNANVKTSAPATSYGPGEMIYRSDESKVYVNTGTAGTPVWTEIGSNCLPLAGGEMSGDIDMNDNEITLSSDENVSIAASGDSMVLNVDTGGSIIIQVTT